MYNLFAVRDCVDIEHRYLPLFDSFCMCNVINGTDRDVARTVFDFLFSFLQNSFSLDVYWLADSSKTVNSMNYHGRLI